MDISIVIPIYNEAGSIGQLYEEIVKVMTSLKKSFEIIFLDDGSTDNTFGEIQNVSKKAKEAGVNLICMRFEPRVGKSGNLQAGFRQATGNIIIAMDGDLQDDPNEIPQFIDKITTGYDLVSGWRFKRQDSPAKIIPSKIFNIITSWLTGIKIHDLNCCFKAYRQEVTKRLNIYGDLYRFIPVLACYKGFRIAEIKVNHRPRKYGKSKYGLRRFFQAFFDLLTIAFLGRFIRKPLHFFGSLGLLSFFCGFAVVSSLFIRKFIGGIPIDRTQYLFLLGLFLIIVGFQFFGIGLLGELVVRINLEKKERYHIRKKIRT